MPVQDAPRLDDLFARPVHLGADPRIEIARDSAHEVPTAPTPESRNATYRSAPLLITRVAPAARARLRSRARRGG